MIPLFFFGSGADSDCCEQLVSGQAFAKKLLIEENFPEACSLNGESFRNYKLLYPQSTKVFLQTISTYPDEAKKHIDRDIVDRCLLYEKDKQSVPFNEIRDYCREWYKIVMEKADNVSGLEGVRSFFLDKAILFDSLDEKFNSLRLSTLNDNAKRIIMVYTQVFALMLKTLYSNSITSDFIWSYEAVFNKLNDPYEIAVDDNSYYYELKKSKLNPTIVTTNYTNLAEISSKNRTIYLHGKLTWFEDLRKLTVHDCTEKEERELLANSTLKIPFIFIPSGVKPIVCSKQIMEFAAFITELNKTNLLIIVGYKFNSEDNHINSIIAEWLKKGNNKLLYLNYNKCVDFSRLKWATDLTRIETDGENFLENDKRYNSKIVSVSADDNNMSRSVFRKIISFVKENA